MSGHEGSVYFVISPAGGQYSQLYSNKNSWNANEWYHITCTWDGTTQAVYVNGALDKSQGQTYSGGWGTTYIGGVSGTPSYSFNGVIDDVRVYNKALSAEEIWQLYHNKAFNPKPTDGETYVDPNPVLSWSPGKDAASHDVYFGTNYNDVNDANTFSPEYKGNYDTNSYDPCSLDLLTTYYWRIDEVNDPNVWKGDIWNFTVVSGKAKNPQPSDGQHHVSAHPVLDWSPGVYAHSHDVYLGTNYNDVNDANTFSSVYRGNFDVNSFDPCSLDVNTTYYWRIDEVNAPNLCKGDVWSFTTEACVVPNVVNMLQQDANAAIIAAGFVVGTITTQYSDTVSYRRVISQYNNYPGCGTAVDMVISKGSNCYLGIGMRDEAQFNAAGRPTCWCYKRQCHGDADGKSQGKSPNLFWTSTNDLTILVAAWQIRGGPVGSPGACADFDHYAGGKSPNIFRVSTNDLTILAKFWNVAGKPDPNCLPGNRIP
ncbi:MAG: LamG-like jellyroll fold domain-containing protein [Sedimentisphaerales bacterium]